MLTRIEAARLAQNEIDLLGSDCILYDEPIAQGEYGWVFGYQSAKYLKTGDFRDMMAGNSPFLVERETGRLHVLGTAQSVGHYVENYLKSGDPHSR